MKSTTTVRRVVLSIIGVLLAVAAGGIGVEAAQSFPDFAIAISPTSQSVQRGVIASYTVTVTSLNGFNGVGNPVTLTTSGGPTGTVLGIGIGTLKPTAGVPSTTTLTVPTSSSTSLGTYTITVSGVSGKLKHSATTGLTVNPIPPSFSLVLTPASLSVDAGSQGTYNVALTRTGGFTSTISLSLSGSLPAGVMNSFSPTSLTGTASSSTLTIAIDSSAKAGSTAITVTGTSSGLSASAQGTLVIAKPQGKPFTISGNVTGLAPGVSQPINLELFNTNKGVISVTNLTVSLTSTSKSSCDASNFEVKQYTGAYPIAVPPNASILLSAVPIASGYRPAITMLNSSDNQDGCKGVSLSLSYSGSAQGN